MFHTVYLLLSFMRGFVRVTLHHVCVYNSEPWVFRQKSKSTSKVPLVLRPKGRPPIRKTLQTGILRLSSSPFYASLL